MKLEFTMSSAAKNKCKAYLESIDEEAKKFNIQKSAFGCYECFTNEMDFICFLGITLADGIIYENAESCYVWFDEDNLIKENALESYNTINERNS